MKTIIGFIWIIFAIILIFFYDKEPQATIMIWGCLIISQIYISQTIKNNDK